LAAVPALLRFDDKDGGVPLLRVGKLLQLCLRMLVHHR